MQVRALGHAVEEGAQRRVVVAQRGEVLRGDRGIEFARHHAEADGKDDGRQPDDRKNDPASQDLSPALCYRVTARACLCLRAA